MNISIFKNTFDTKPEHCPALEVVTQLRDGKWRSQIELIRTKYESTPGSTKDKKKAIKSLKERLPAVTWSGQFRERNKLGLKEHSGLLCVDLDDLPMTPSAAKAKLSASPYLWLAMTSPSGTGLKAIFRVPASSHSHFDSFLAVERHLGELGLQGSIDQQCKDISRLCSVSHDTDLLFNSQAIEILLLTDTLGCCNSSIPLNPESLNPESSISPISYQLTARGILQNVENMKAAKQKLRSANKGLLKLYNTLVESRFEATQNRRNAFLTQAVPFLYRAVGTDVLMQFVRCFYECNQAIFNDPIEQHMKEAGAMLSGVAKTFLLELNESERQLYEALPDHDREAFRIFRDLAMLERDDSPRGTLFISHNQLGCRLLLHPMEARTIFGRFRSYQLLDLIQKGDRHIPGMPVAEGKKRLASTYKWMLPLNGVTESAETKELAA